MEWAERTFSGLEPRVAWNQPVFTDHGTFIIGISVSAGHLAVSPGYLGGPGRYLPESTCPVRHQGRALPGRSRRIWPAEAEVRGTNCGPRPVPDGENALYKQGASAALDGKPAEPCGRQCAARSKEDDPCPTGCNLNNPRICSSTGKIPWTGGPGGARHSRPHGRRTSRCSSA